MGVLLSTPTDCNVALNASALHALPDQIRSTGVQRVVPVLLLCSKDAIESVKSQRWLRRD